MGARQAARRRRPKPRADELCFLGGMNAFLVFKSTVILVPRALLIMRPKTTGRSLAPPADRRRPEAGAAGPRRPSNAHIWRCTTACASLAARHCSACRRARARRAAARARRPLQASKALQGRAARWPERRQNCGPPAQQHPGGPRALPTDIGSRARPRPPRSTHTLPNRRRACDSLEGGAFVPISPPLDHSAGAKPCLVCWHVASRPPPARPWWLCWRVHGPPANPPPALEPKPPNGTPCTNLLHCWMALGAPPDYKPILQATPGPGWVPPGRLHVSKSGPFPRTHAAPPARAAKTRGACSAPRRDASRWRRQRAWGGLHSTPFSASAACLGAKQHGAALLAPRHPPAAAPPRAHATQNARRRRPRARLFVRHACAFLSLCSSGASLAPRHCPQRQMPLPAFTHACVIKQAARRPCTRASHACTTKR
ncbi:MAG: hypothetical protein J3K34DRAFT_106277 [Monoraphidium minutum]|nr:MAG: hypothetical protein J3K34DRAFT_106277 [Monoraphidium minutum]